MVDLWIKLWTAKLHIDCIAPKPGREQDKKRAEVRDIFFEHEETVLRVSKTLHPPEKYEWSTCNYFELSLFALVNYVFYSFISL